MRREWWRAWWLVLVVAIVGVTCGRNGDGTLPDRGSGSVIKGFGDFQGERLTETQIMALLKKHGVPTREMGKAICTSYFESNFFTRAQHDNRFERKADPNGPKTDKGTPLRYFFTAKPTCLRSEFANRAQPKVCVATKNDDLKGYKKTPELLACLDALRKTMVDMKTLVRTGTPAAMEQAKQCSFDYGLYQINDFWGVYGIYPNGRHAPCANASGLDMFDLDRNVACMVKMARCGRTSCNFDAWRGYSINKDLCDKYRPGDGFP